MLPGCPAIPRPRPLDRRRARAPAGHGGARGGSMVGTERRLATAGERRR